MARALELARAYLNCMLFAVTIHFITILQNIVLFCSFYSVEKGVLATAHTFPGEIS